MLWLTHGHHRKLHILEGLAQLGRRQLEIIYRARACIRMLGNARHFLRISKNASLGQRHLSRWSSQCLEHLAARSDAERNTEFPSVGVSQPPLRAVGAPGWTDRSVIGRCERTRRILSAYGHYDVMTCHVDSCACLSTRLAISPRDR